MISDFSESSAHGGVAKDAASISIGFTHREFATTIVHFAFNSGGSVCIRDLKLTAVIVYAAFNSCLSICSCDSKFATIIVHAAFNRGGSVRARDAKHARIFGVGTDICDFFFRIVQHAEGRAFCAGTKSHRLLAVGTMHSAHGSFGVHTELQGVFLAVAACQYKVRSIVGGLQIGGDLPGASGHFNATACAVCKNSSHWLARGIPKRKISTRFAGRNSRDVGAALAPHIKLSTIWGV